ncbi:septum formation inhibitor Maf [Paracrocinitomix mangrovi]|uniref:septum formation inhibitor Maf n=1 Tax=Paracrocinitomix mangrovi TaxID=2862509 RepID=UPI001C8EEA50|nr:septum formation inhibitor Maf [Paracrocinitomix mangrovi]UKN00461.1 septum formation inhibitor Maf [Paracrocinitomix mangrovi]
MKMTITSFYFGILLSVLLSCNSSENDQTSPENVESFNSYWYDGQAEISSYELKQARYGEIREGNAVMIFVTEPFSKTYNTKADEERDDNVSVLKMNFTKNFVTGIYPYSIMSSVFYPVNKIEHATKLSCSTQEWCGQTYMEMIRNRDFDVTINSYFEGESVNHSHQPLNILEDEIWTMIRVRPEQLPVGEQKIIPAFSYLRLAHKKLTPYQCKCSKKVEDDITIYSMSYPEIERDVEIQFETKFPHKILKWKEAYPCGSCESQEKLESSGVLMESMKIDYWNKNSKADSLSRFKLGLH